MKSVKSFKNDSEKAAFWLSKYFKTIVIQIESENYVEASESLKWLNLKIESLFEDRDLAVHILDPNRYYKKREIPDFSQIDFTKVKVIQGGQEIIEDEPKAIAIRPEKFLEFLDYDFIDTIIAGVYDIYHASLSRNENLGKFARYILHNLFIHINNLEVDLRKFDKYSFLNDSVISKIQYRNNQIFFTQTGTRRDTNITYLSGVGLFLELLRNKRLDAEIVPYCCNAIFDSLRQMLTFGKDDYFKWFVETLVDGGYSANLSKYQITRIKLAVGFNKENSESEIDKLIKNIDELRGRDILYYLEDFLKKKDQLERLKDQLNADPEFDKELEKDLDETFDYFRDRFIECQISILVVKLQVNLIFHEKFDLVYYIYEYNQPSDSDATFSNKEPYPVFLDQILDWSEFESKIDHSIFTSGFVGHHGTTRYIKLTWLIAFVYSFSNSWRQYVKQDVIIKSFTDRLTNRSKFEYYKTFFEDLKQRFSFQRERSRLFKKFDNQVLDGIDKLITIILHNVEKAETAAKIGDEVKIKNLDYLARGVINSYGENKFYTKREIFNVELTSDEDPADIAIGVNEYLDRSFFSENFSKSIYGLEEGYARALYESENLLIESFMTQYLKRESAVKLTEIESVLEKYANDKHLIILVNVHLSSLLNSAGAKFTYLNDYNDPYYGGTYNGVPIYSLRLFGESSLRVIEKDKLGRVELVKSARWEKEEFQYYKDVYYKIIDFKSSPHEIDSFLSSPPEWLLKKYPEKSAQIEFLKTNLWIRILKKVRYVNDVEKGSYIGKRYKVDV